MISLNYRDSRPIYEQIKDGLRKLIVTGAIKADDKIPSVRALATQLAINPNTIQRAYRSLEVEGWIATVPGKGCFVCSTDDTRERERQHWYHAFDDATTALIALGVTRQNLVDRIGGNQDA